MHTQIKKKKEKKKIFCMEHSFKTESDQKSIHAWIYKSD